MKVRSMGHSGRSTSEEMRASLCYQEKMEEEGTVGIQSK